MAHVSALTNAFFLAAELHSNPKNAGPPKYPGEWRPKQEKQCEGTRFETVVDDNT